MRGDWFYTGDRFERRSDGAYAYVGRNDEMLKVGGLWASPVDMENVLLDHPEVIAAGVVGVTIEDQSRIAAFVERTPGETPDELLAEQLREMCKARLRRYEYPHVVHVLDALPRTANGKVQRFKLRKLATERAGG
jgi:acyl-coenzyme A synthetase/AMP-(fatty) acid ligase